jgi:hypothetical protein
MNDKNEPRRLFDSDDAPTGLRTLLVQAHEDVAPDAAVAQLVGRVERQASMAGSPGKWAIRRSTKLVTKLLLAVALVGAGGAVWLWARDRAAVHVVVPPREMPEPEHGRAENAATEPPVPSTSPDDQTPTAEAALSPRRHVVNSGGRRDLRGRGAGDPETAIFTGIDSASAEEYALLRSARRTLADNPARAIQFTDQHRRRFPNGMLTQEREVISIEAEVRLGRTRQAKARSVAFFFLYSNSPYRDRVMRAVASLPVEPQ